MKEFLVLMHADALPGAERLSDWGPYLHELSLGGYLQGGSSLGPSVKYSLSCADGDSTGSSRFSGYILLRAADQAAARLLLSSNPAFEAGGTVEILERVPD